MNGGGTWFSRGVVPNKIRDKLFISGYEGANDVTVMKEQGISHILDATGTQKLFPEDFVYHLVSWDDSPDQEVLSHLPSCVEFVEKSISEGTGVLIHCAAGISRSSTVACAYLMKTDNISFETALEIVRAARPICSPNGGFRIQLKLWYEMGFQLEGTTKAHKIYHTKSLQHEMSAQGKLTTPLMITHMNEDLKEGKVYCCKKCDNKLFTEDHIITHERGVNRFGYTFWNAKKEDCSLHNLIPLSWMNDIHIKEDGNFMCPGNCGTLIGSWSWNSIPCNCGTILSPAFVVNITEVACSKSEETK